MSSSSDNSRFCPVCGVVYTDDTEFCPKDGSKVTRPEKIIAGRFVLKGAIGLGNMGTVHRAVQLPMGRQVAVKILHSELMSNPEMVQRFEREALAASTVDHPNAITIYDSGRTEDGQVYIAMEYLDGESLAALLRREHALPPRRAVELWLPVVKAMVVAHRKGILHRDLKPDNVFISRKVTEGGASEEIVKVLDFGIAKLLQEAEGPVSPRSKAKTLAGTRIGTALYMSPEQLEGREAGKYSDVYALGLILIEMIAGRLPWGRSAEEADTVMTMMRLVTPPKPLRELCPGQTFSPELQQFFDELLAIEPARRPQDAGELLKRLAQVPECQLQGGPRAGVDTISGAETAELPSAGFIDGGEPTAARPAELTTQPMLPSVAPLGPKGLASLETVRTLVPDELLKSGAADLPSLPTTVTRPANRQSSEELNPSGLLKTEPVRPRVERSSSDVVKTLPSPVAAPQLEVSPPTVPLMVARLQGQKGKVKSTRQDSQPTLDMNRWSSNTLRTSRRRPAVYVMTAAILAVALLAIGYFMLRSGPAKNTPPDRVSHVVPPGPHPPSPPVASPVPPPARMAPAEADSGSPATRRRTDEAVPDKDKSGELQVGFRFRKPDSGSAACGGEVLRPCDGGCAIVPGERCVVKSPGYAPKRFKYEELDRRTRHGRLRMDVTLQAAN